MPVWMEHPDLRSRHSFVGAQSIWFLEQVRRLAVLPITRIHNVLRCDYGGRSMKPTRLFTMRLYRMDFQLARCRHCRRPTSALHGTGAHGQWRTAQAKEYLPGVSAAIAGTMLDAT